jgi:hypothetical protein
MQYSVRIVTALAGAIAFIVLLETIFRWAEQRTHPQHHRRPFWALIITVLSGVALIFSLILFQLKGIPLPSINSYVVGDVPDFYAFLLQQPNDTLIASLDPMVDNLPSFTKRSVLVSREHALPYHKGYYTQFRQRAIDLIDAQYSSNLQQVRRFIQQYEVDFWVVTRSYLDSYLSPNPSQKQPPPELDYQWLKQFPATAEARQKWEQGMIPALPRFAQHCSVFKNEDLVVLQTSCIADADG